MSDFSVDFSDVQGGDFDAIPAGVYNVAVTDWSRTETKNEGKLPAGTPGINWEFTIQDGQYENRKLWINHWIHPNTLGFLKTFLEKTGRYTDEQLSGSFDLDPDSVVGAELQAVVTVRQYEGDDRNDIKKFRKAGETASASSSSMLP
ncbi:MAG: DUF669 domain-containing protein [Desulfurellales bacterium]|nr:MAG: DUF669 domain-containing protein [Desulfurellales bacterium]